MKYGSTNRKESHNVELVNQSLIRRADMKYRPGRNPTVIHNPPLSTCMHRRVSQYLTPHLGCGLHPHADTSMTFCKVIFPPLTSPQSPTRDPQPVPSPVSNPYRKPFERQSPAPDSTDPWPSRQDPQAPLLPQVLVAAVWAQ
jgi:hypothetical protein